MLDVLPPPLVRRLLTRERMLPHHRPLEAVVRHRGRLLSRCLIRRGRYVIGQEEKNEIVIDDASVSGIHARLAVVSEDEIYIEDLGSANGTLVNGQPTSGHTRVTFTCKVEIGATTLEFQRGGQPASAFSGRRSSL